MLENESDKKATTAADLLNVDGIFCIPDVPEHNLPREVLKVLLFDHSTNKNIIWATKDYTTRGPGFPPSKSWTDYPFFHQIQAAA